MMIILTETHPEKPEDSGESGRRTSYFCMSKRPLEPGSNGQLPCSAAQKNPQPTNLPSFSWLIKIGILLLDYDNPQYIALFFIHELIINQQKYLAATAHTVPFVLRHLIN